MGWITQCQELVWATKRVEERNPLLQFAEWLLQELRNWTNPPSLASPKGFKQGKGGHFLFCLPEDFLMIFVLMTASGGLLENKECRVPVNFAQSKRRPHPVLFAAWSSLFCPFPHMQRVKTYTRSPSRNRFGTGTNNSIGELNAGWDPTTFALKHLTFFPIGRLGKEWKNLSGT